MQQPTTRRPGDRIVRHARVRPVTIDLATTRPKPPRPMSPFILAYAFAALIALGTLLLALPFASEERGWTSFLDAFFTATSAATVTGLTVVDSATAWTPFGKTIIMILIQVGGLGIMTLSTLWFLVIGRRLGLQERFALSVEASGTATVGGAVRLVRRIAVIVLIAELVGFVAFTIRFTGDFPIPTAMWHGLFQSVSSFNNAGFVVLPGEGFHGYGTDLPVLLTTLILVMVGGISYALIMDMFRNRRWSRFGLDTKLVLTASLGLWLLGMLIIFISEYSNDATLGSLNVGHKVSNALFESVSGRTAGFESVAVGAMREYTWFLFMGLMFIGGVAGSTTGGIKVNTFAVLATSVVASLRGRPKAEAFRRQVADQQVFNAVTLAVLAAGLIFTAVFVLTIIEDGRPVELVFEAVSAFGTVGNSTGVTRALSNGGQLLIMLLMFVGKIGPLTLMLLLGQRTHPTPYRYAVDNVRIG